MGFDGIVLKGCRWFSMVFKGFLESKVLESLLQHIICNTYKSLAPWHGPEGPRSPASRNYVLDAENMRLESSTNPLPFSFVFKTYISGILMVLGPKGPRSPASRRGSGQTGTSGHTRRQGHADTPPRSATLGRAPSSRPRPVRSVFINSNRKISN